MPCSMYLSRWMESNLILGTLSLFTDNRDYNFSESRICWLISTPLTSSRKGTLPDGFTSREANAGWNSCHSSGRPVSEMAVVWWKKFLTWTNGIGFPLYHLLDVWLWANHTYSLRLTYKMLVIIPLEVYIINLAVYVAIKALIHNKASYKCLALFLLKQPPRPNEQMRHGPQTGIQGTKAHKIQSCLFNTRNMAFL